jgi:hypothetical protein
MRHSIRQSQYQPEFEGVDPVALVAVPLAILLLAIIALRAIVAASVV